MCGILGTLNWDPPLNQLDLEEITASLAHRGPDDSGYWSDSNVSLGFQRLSIIDLSAAGRQPMPNERGTLRLVYNGEIYNYATLRKQLVQKGHTFTSQSDTETIVHGYEQWGPEVVEHLRGMFAFAIWDQREQTLFLARDRLGIKPLYYYWDGRHFAFASEIKALTALPQVNLGHNNSAIWDYLTYLYIPTPKTIYKHIRQVPAGHTLTVSSGKTPAINKYWDLPNWGKAMEVDDPMAQTGWQEAVDAVRCKLHETVQMHMIADVPVGILLSGGIDSGTVAALAAHSKKADIKTFSMGFDVESHTELPYARQVATKLGTHHHEHICSRVGLDEWLHRMLEVYDQPFADSSGIPTLEVSNLASSHVKVVLSGDGGDEVFAGYKWHRSYTEMPNPSLSQQLLYNKLLTPVLEALSPLPKITGLISRYQLNVRGKIGVERYGALRSPIKPFQKARLLPDMRNEFKDYDNYWHYRKFWRDDLDPVSRLQYVDLKTYLPDDIMTKVDRASMSTSLEVRPPLLDHEFVELVASLPPEYRYGKRILRALATNLLPPEIVSRSKKGFSAPLLDWLHPTTRNGARLGGMTLWAMLLLDEWKR